VANHPTPLPSNVLKILAHDEYSSIVQIVAQRKESAQDPDLVDGLTHHANFFVRAQFASNPAVPPNTLTLLADDPAYEVRAAVAGNPATPQATLTALANDEIDTVRLHVARNPETPKETLIALRKDPRLYVRNAATESATNGEMSRQPSEA
jgi:hypothetical protein